MVEKARAARDSAALLARYDEAIAALPALSARLAPLRAEVARHVAAFGGRVPEPNVPGRPAARPSPTARPVTARDTLAVLAGAERQLADRRAKELLTVPGDLARLLASVAAAGAAHVVLLGAVPAAAGRTA